MAFPAIPTKPVLDRLLIFKFSVAGIPVCHLRCAISWRWAGSKREMVPKQVEKEAHCGHSVGGPGAHLVWRFSVSRSPDNEEMMWLLSGSLSQRETICSGQTCKPLCWVLVSNIAQRESKHLSQNPLVSLISVQFIVTPFLWDKQKTKKS